jgi:hypothetical protein
MSAARSSLDARLGSFRLTQALNLALRAIASSSPPSTPRRYTLQQGATRRTLPSLMPDCSMQRLIVSDGTYVHSGVDLSMCVDSFAYQVERLKQCVGAHRVLL